MKRAAVLGAWILGEYRIHDKLSSDHDMQVNSLNDWYMQSVDLTGDSSL
ncbi:MAG: hypothetical protein KKA36_10085 [Gammaproteobacteria bacterium]|nr:hypothetical protein [Gammaproteobacteria bacterium]MBU2479428.1 hypothetical protein [Gammaproteobacteria bacterium]